MKTIYKYRISPHNCKIEMPIGAEIITAKIQAGLIYVWAIVNPEAETEEREISVFPTGQPFEDGNRRYIATVQYDIPNLDYHIFENIKQ